MVIAETAAYLGITTEMVNHFDKKTTNSEKVIYLKRFY